MRHYYSSHIRPAPITRAFKSRLHFFLLGLLFASCSGCGDSNGPPPLGNDASLSSLSASGVTLDPAFSSSVTEYTASVPNSTTSVTVNATTRDGSASFSINGGGDTNVALVVGDNRIDVLVTAENGSTTQTYVVIVTRAASDNADLSGLELTNIELVPRFDTEHTAYTASVDYLTVATQVTATAEDATASIRLNGEAVSSGVTSDPLALGVGTNTIAITVTAEDGATRRTYNVVVTRQSASTFAQAAYAKASNTEANDAFGFSASLSADGNTLAVGAVLEDSAATGIGGNQSDNNEGGSGAVYVFSRDSAGDWAQQAYIKASNSYRLILFGHNVALSADGATLAVSAIYEGHARSGDFVETDFPTGAVYIFNRDGVGIWTEQSRIRSSYVVEPGDQMGAQIALSGDGATLAACVFLARWSDASGDVHAVEVFTRDNGGVWSEQAFIEGDFSCFNGSLAMSSNAATLAMGTYDGEPGAVYMYSRDSAAVWAQQARITASNAEVHDRFGWAVALSDDGATLAVGANAEDSASTGVNGDQMNNSATGSGAAYVFARENESVWTQQAYIKASNTGELDGFGSSVTLSADGARLAVGAPQEGSAATGVNGDQMDNNASRAGAVYVFARDSAGVWAQQSYLKSSNTDPDDRFGLRSSLSADGAKLAVGARYEDSAAIGVNGDQADNSSEDSGAVYIFER